MTFTTQDRMSFNEEIANAIRKKLDISSQQSKRMVHKYASVLEQLGAYFNPSDYAEEVYNAELSGIEPQRWLDKIERNRKIGTNVTPHNRDRDARFATPSHFVYTVAPLTGGKISLPAGQVRINGRISRRAKVKRDGLNESGKIHAEPRR